MPIAIIEQTDELIRGEVNSNNGWRFEILVQRSADAGPLPTAEQLQEILYAIDP